MVKQTDGLVIKIRGIYTTALTHFFLKQGNTVTQPSRPVLRLFSNRENLRQQAEYRVVVGDVRDKQGIVLKGPDLDLESIQAQMSPVFWDAVYRRGGSGQKGWLEVDFPAVSKGLLDELRREVRLTIDKHHQWKRVNSKLVDLAENVNLELYPERWKEISWDLEKRLLWSEYLPGKELTIEHVKPDGSIIHLSEGIILEADPGQGRLVLERTRFKGRGSYDGLGNAKHRGDYAISTVLEGAWRYHHDYYRLSGEFIGRYVNINTPVELYPDRIRYIDLEVDVAFWPDSSVQCLDQEELDTLHEAGLITSRLLQWARDEAAQAAATGLWDNE